MDHPHLSSNTEEKVVNIGVKAELERVRKENENLRLMVEAVSAKYSKLQALLVNLQQQKQLMMSSSTNYIAAHHQFSSCRHDPNETPRINYNTQLPASKASPDQLFVRADPKDKTLVVKDGYQWRKYGQKITKDNPSPRAYFRCSMAPGCQAKKKVQRSVEDDSFLVATYEGEHNHGMDGSRESLSSVLETSSIKASMANPFQRDVTLDLTLCTTSQSDQQNCRPSQKIVQQDKERKIEEYVASLTNDHNFTVALAAAVARFIYH